MFTSHLIIGLIVGLGVLLLTSCVMIVRQQTVLILETFGKFTGTRRAGIGFKLPWPIQKVAGELSLRTLSLHQTIDTKTADNAFLKVGYAIQYRIADAAKAFYSLEDAEAQITDYVSNAVRSKISHMKFDEVYQNQDQISSQVGEGLRDQLNEFGFILSAVLIEQPEAPQAIQDALNDVIASERQRDAAKLKGEAKRSLILAEANADMEAKELSGLGLAKQRIAIAEGNAKVIEIFSRTNPTGSNEDSLAFIAMTQQMDTLREIGRHGNMIVTPVDNAMVGQGIASLRAILRQDPSLAAGSKLAAAGSAHDVTGTQPRA